VNLEASPIEQMVLDLYPDLATSTSKYSDLVLDGESLSGYVLPGRIDLIQW